MKKFMRRLGFGATAAVALAAFASYDAANVPGAGHHRPVAVASTPYPQQDAHILGLRVRYIDVGEGEPVVIIPGLTSRIEECDALTGRLTERFRVLVFDYPGSGYSDKPDREYSLSFYDDVLFAFLDERGIDRAHVIGGSLGGNLAIRAAYRDPARIDRVAAWGPGSAWEAKPALAAVMRVVGGKTLFWPTIRVQSDYWYSEGWPGADAAVDGAFAYYGEVLSPGFVRMYWDLATEQTGWSLTEIAADVRRPVLLIWGDRDDGWDMGPSLRRLDGLMPDSRLLVIEGSGHAIAAEQPDVLADALIAFLSEEDDE